MNRKPQSNNKKSRWIYIFLISKTKMRTKVTISNKKYCGNYSFQLIFEFF